MATEEHVHKALEYLGEVSIDGSLEERERAARQLQEAREAVRAVATERVLEQRASEAPPRPTHSVPVRRVRKLFTPYGTLTHAITGKAIRPATAREQGSFIVAKRHGETCLLIAHIHNGQRFEEPYVITDTKTLELVEE